MAFIAGKAPTAIEPFAFVGSLGPDPIACPTVFALPAVKQAGLVVTAPEVGSIADMDFGMYTALAPEPILLNPPHVAKSAQLEANGTL